MPMDPELTTPSYWFLPGGGLEPGESFHEAAVRELWEETRISGVEIGPCVWLREQVLRFPFGELMLFHERFFPVRVEGVEVSIDGLHGIEADAYAAHRWWTLDELRSTDEVVFPERFAQHVEPILAGSLPTAPVWISDRT